MRAYFIECTRCAFKLLEAFCIGLNLDPSTLHHLFEGGIGFMRLNYYAPHPQICYNSNEQPPMLGIHPHTDAGFLTILKQDSVPGLEVWKNGAWHSVQPIKDAFTINVGDQFQVLTNNEVKAPLHRVRAPLLDKRYSAPFFFNVSQPYQFICKYMIILCS